MKTSFPILLAVCALIQPAGVSADEESAGGLIQRMLASQLTKGFVIRAKLTVADPAANTRSAAQLMIKGRTDASGVRLLYQVLWPKEQKGTALSIERPAKGGIAGFIYTPPGTVTPLTPPLLANPWLESDLTIEDLAEDYWHWPAPKFSGDATINGEICKAVDLRPSGGSKSSYSLIRAWISPGKLAPLSIVKYGHDGKPAKQVVVQKLSRHDKVWVPVITVIQVPGRTRTTTLEISRGDRDMDIPLPQFSVEEVKKAVP